MKKPSAGMWRGIACGAMLAVTMAFVLPTTFGASSFEAQFDENAKQITQLEEQVKDLENQASPDAASINKGLHSAADAGRKVAEYQTKYQNIDAAVTPDDVTANAEALSPYFADDAQSGRQPWFTPSKGDAKVVWTFESTYSFQNDSIPVIWLCTIDGSDELVAYATATYDAESGKFSNVAYQTTANAAKYIDATVENENKTAIDELIKSIQAQDTGESDPGMSEEDAQNQNDAREWLKQQNKDGGEK